MPAQILPCQRRPIQVQRIEVGGRGSPGRGGEIAVHRHGGKLLRLKMASCHGSGRRSEEHTSELQSLMRISYAVFCLKKKKNETKHTLEYRHANTNNLRR